MLKKKNYQILLCEDKWEYQSFLLGDFNEDKKISEEEIKKILKYDSGDLNLEDVYESSPLKNKITFEQFQILWDFDKDGDITSYDARKAFDSQEEIVFSKATSVPVLEIGSSSSDFAGQAFNIEFYSKIDGTHELSFELPQYYFDPNSGEMILNELIELLVNKCQIELRIEDKTYFMVINSRTDKEEKGQLISYSYTCNDAFIEELSKNGYGLVFSDEVEGNGLGTIHELAEKIAEGSEWGYDAEKTGVLYEYKKELEYNIEQGRYDEIHTPIPVHKVSYIPELKRYCNELMVFKKKKDNYHKIYCYDDSEQITSNTVQNYISNGDDFVDYIGWQTYLKSGQETSAGLILDSKKVNDEYLLHLSPISTIKQSYLLNDTAAESRKSIQGGSPYFFKWEAGEGNKAKITQILIFSKNPLIGDVKPEYTLTKEIESGKSYVLKPLTSIFNPYIVFNVNCGEGDFFAKNFTFFPIKGKNTNTQTDNSEINNLKLLSELTNGNIITDEQINIISIPSDAPTAYTHHQVRYFIRDNYHVVDSVLEKQIIKDNDEDTLTYLDFEEEVFINSYIYDKNKKDFIVFNQDGKIILEKSDDPNFDPLEMEAGDKNTIYKSNKNGKYYQYYSITIKDRTNGMWDYALYGEGTNDKRRTLSAERSNRFNLIQNLAELFKVWPVFEMKRDETGKIIKKFWFRENCIKENFSGFHKGVNLTSLSRTINSDEIVTKMYVEDIESDFTDDGFVTIRKSSLNPWGENFYYNFQYYVNQKLINLVSTVNGVTCPIIEHDMNDLYIRVKKNNNIIFDLNDKVANAKIELSNLRARLTSLATSIAAMVERTTSINTDLTNYENEMAEPDKQKLNTNLDNYSKMKEKYQTELDTTQTEYDQLEKEVITWQEELSKLVERKKTLIADFENKYSQFIKEGVWTDNSYIDNDTYYLDSLDVMNTSSMPKVDWTINVVDGSLDEDFEAFKFEVGDQTILVDDEFFMKNPNEGYRFEVLISGIKEYLDTPTKNIIEVRNYRTGFEDIFQRISAATQTLELNEQTYNKAANFTNDGQVDQSILQNTLLNNALILANATDNSYILDNTGLHLQSIINPSKKLRAIADGIFLSNSADANGQPKWMTGITADGINASVITSGEINTSLIKIFSRGTPSFSWSELGITAYKYKDDKVDSNSFLRFDSFGLYSVEGKDSSIKFNYDSEGNPWFRRYTNRAEALDYIIDNSLLSITDKGFNLNVKNGEGSIQLGYQDNDGEVLSTLNYGLYIKDTNGKIVVQLQNDGNNKISGWKIQEYNLVNLLETGEKTEDNKDIFHIFGMQVPHDSTEDALAIGKITNINSWGEANFRVTHDGILYATGAKIEGTFLAGNPKNNSVELTLLGKEPGFPTILFNTKTQDSPEGFVDEITKCGLTFIWDEQQDMYFCSSVIATYLSESTMDIPLSAASEILWGVNKTGEVIFAPRKTIDLKDIYNPSTNYVNNLVALNGQLFENYNTTILSYTSPYTSDYYIGATPLGLWSGWIQINGATLYFDNGVLYNATW